MAQKFYYEQMADDIVRLVGGKENVQSLGHCMTRLRFILKDDKKADAEAIKAVGGVLGVVNAGGQFMVILGQNLLPVYDAAIKRHGLNAGAAIDENLDDPKIKEPLTLKSAGLAALSYVSTSVTALQPGLVAGGMHQNPVPYADVVTTTTHKTLRGPRGGLILTNNAYLIKRINSAIFPGTQGGPLEHVIAAKAVCFGEALKPEFKDYARKIVENAAAMADELTARGVKLVSGGTDNHLLLVDLTDSEMTGKELEHNLDEVHITANKNTVPGEKRSPFVTSGVRLGTPAVTTRGMGPAEMKEIADCIADCIFDFEGKKDDIAARVASLTARFPLYE